MDKRLILEEMAVRRARHDMLAFMKLVWWMPQPFVAGLHTVAIADRLTKAVEDYRNGKSTFLLVAVPFRHGKSDLVSRALPAFFLGACADMMPDVIMSAYAESLVRTFSKTVKRIMCGDKYGRIFPNVMPQRGSNKATEWQVDGSAGTVTAQGLNGSMVGKGGNLIILDDYCKNRGEARSDVFRNRTWDGFTNLMTRRNAPASIVIVCATPWHVDDVRGRIRNAMKTDPDFPTFEELNFPARKPGQYDYLFPERFSPEWYDGQRATLGKFAAAQLDCEPMFEGGERFDVSRVIFHDDLAGFDNTGAEVRFWDLASTDKERSKDDPDWTFGVRGHLKRLKKEHGQVEELWISDIIAIQAEAPVRDSLIRKTAMDDGNAVRQAIEAFGGYKDAYTSLKNLLYGIRIVVKSNLPGDKSVKAAPLEPIFEACNVHVLRKNIKKSTLDEWIRHFSEFPSGKHDDAVDATAGVYHECTRKASGMLM